VSHVVARILFLFGSRGKYVMWLHFIYVHGLGAIYRCSTL
jgi:hypothetical protein